MPIVGREFVVSGRDTPTLLDLVEKPFDQVARAIQQSASIRDPRVTSFVEAGAEEGRTQPIVMRLTRRESEMGRQAIPAGH